MLKEFAKAKGVPTRRGMYPEVSTGPIIYGLNRHVSLNAMLLEPPVLYKCIRLQKFQAQGQWQYSYYQHEPNVLSILS